MSIFRSRRDEAPNAGSSDAAPSPAPASVPAARDADVAMPAFRPNTASATVANLRPNAPTAPAAPAPRTGMPMAPAQRPGGGAATTEAGERRTLVVGKGISLQGTVADAERLVVDGTVESQMIQASQLFVSHSGVFKGEVQVDEAEIAGVFDGTITANGSLIIRATGKVLGVARTKRLSVEDGGQLSGRMEMLTDTPARPGFPAAVPAPSAPRALDGSES